MLNTKFTPHPLLKTSRLILRKIKISDSPELFFLRTHKGVLKYIDKHFEKSEKETRTFIRKLIRYEKAGKAVNWAICVKGSNVLIGNVALFNVNKEHHRAEIGYLLHPDLNGQGIMSEAVKAVLEIAFKKYKFHSIEANVNPKNKASINLLKKNKFKQEAYFKENYYFEGKFLDSAIFSRVAR